MPQCPYFRPINQVFGEEAMTDERQTAWQRAGHAFDESPSSLAVALKESDLDWEVETRSVIVPSSNHGMRVATQYQSIVRKDTDEVIGMVGSRYQAVQHVNLLSIVDDIIDVGGIDSTWCTGGGREVGVALKMRGTYDIGGVDLIQPYLLFRARHDGRSAVKVIVTPVQMSCTNQLPSITRKAKADGHIVSIRHDGRAESRMAEIAFTLQSASEQMEATTKEMNDLAGRTLTEREAHAHIDSIVRFCADRKSVIERDRAGIAEMLASSTTLNDRLRGSRFGLLHAVTEYYDHGRRYRSQESAFNSIQGGPAAKARSACLTVLNGGVLRRPNPVRPVHAMRPQARRAAHPVAS